MKWKEFQRFQSNEFQRFQSNEFQRFQSIPLLASIFNLSGFAIYLERSYEKICIQSSTKSLKKQKLDEQVEVQVDSDQEEDEIKKYIKIVPGKEITIDVIPLATKPPVIVDWKIIIIDSLDDAELSLDAEDSPKQGKMIEELDKDKNVNLVKSSKQGEAQDTAKHRMEFSTASS
nr:hypothetical protein [Tanacetum cinerariifolium]